MRIRRSGEKITRITFLIKKRQKCPRKCDSQGGTDDHLSSWVWFFGNSVDTCETWRKIGEVASQIRYRSYRLWQASLMSYAMTIARAGCTPVAAPCHCGSRSTGSWRKKKARIGVVVSSVKKRLRHRNIWKYYSCRLGASFTAFFFSVCRHSKFVVFADTHLFFCPLLRSLFVSRKRSPISY